MAFMRLLILEPDAPLALFLQKALQAQQHVCDLATCAAHAGTLLAKTSYTAMIMELALPGEDAIAMLQTVRANWAQLSILALAPSGATNVRVAALDAGADDCMVKPFSFAELSARLRALTRRVRPDGACVLRVADLELDRIQRTVTRSGRSIELTTREFALLEYLMCNAGTALARNRIIEHVWRLELDNTTNVIDVYINYLRKKIDSASPQKLIRTVRGVGYEVAVHPPARTKLAVNTSANGEAVHQAGER